jgi:hypothetical protein
MKLQVSHGGAPAGTYLAQFVGVDTTNSNDFGPGLRWKFIVTQGELVGRMLSRVTGDKPTPANSCGKLLAGMLGQPLIVDKELDPDQFIGRSFLVVVAPSKTGQTRIEAVIPAP